MRIVLLVCFGNGRTSANSLHIFYCVSQTALVGLVDYPDDEDEEEEDEEEEQSPRKRPRLSS